MRAGLDLPLRSLVIIHIGAWSFSKHMKIYTKTGDKGQTGLFGGQRVSKSSLRITSYGHVDELNSLLGVCRSLNQENKNDFLEEILHQLQEELFIVGADLATPHDTSNSSLKIERITGKHVAGLEKWIDEIDLKVDPLKNFILPGGTILSAHLHLARCVCRRAERAIVALQSTQAPTNNSELCEREGEAPIRLSRLEGATQAPTNNAERAIVALQLKEPINTDVVVYLNRLSDLLFMMGRYTNMLAGKSEEKWKRNKSTL